MCWREGSATGATSVPSQGHSQQDAVSPVSSSPAGTHKVCPQGRVGTGGAIPLPSGSPLCPGWHHGDSPTAPTPISSPRQLSPDRAGLLGCPLWAMGPSNRDDGGRGGGALCHGNLLIKAGAFGVGFPISKWLRVALGHSLPCSDGCGWAENVLHSSHPWAGALQQVLTLSQPQNQQGDLRSPWRVEFPVGISAHPGQGDRLPLLSQHIPACTQQPGDGCPAPTLMRPHPSQIPPPAFPWGRKKWILQENTTPEPPVLDPADGGSLRSPAQAGALQEGDGGSPQKFPGSRASSQSQTKRTMSKKNESTWFFPRGAGHLPAPTI